MNGFHKWKFFRRSLRLNLMQHTVHGLRNKFMYVLRTVPNITQHLLPLDAEIDKFIGKLFPNHSINESDRILLSLPPKMGGLGILIPSNIADLEYAKFRKVTESLTMHVIDQVQTLQICKEDIKRKRSKVKAAKQKINLDMLDKIKHEATDERNIVLRESLNQDRQIG